MCKSLWAEHNNNNNSTLFCFWKNILEHCDNLQLEIKLVQVGYKESETKFSLVVNLIKEVKLFPTLTHLNEW